VLQLEHRLWVEQVHFTFTAPLVLTTNFKFSVGKFGWTSGVCRPVSSSDFARDHVKVNAAKA
jgi:hypothetical protein